MATSGGGDDITSCGEALGCVTEFFSPEKTKEVMGIFSKALAVIEQMPVLSNNTDAKTQQVYTAACNVRDAVTTTFAQARAYIVKCYGLAEFICDEKEYTIESIQEGRAGDFKDFLEEVLDKSQCCQKDINQLMDSINQTQQPMIEEEKAKVVDIQKVASNQEMYGRLMAALGLFGAVGGGGGALGAGVLGIGGITFLEFVVTGAVGVALAVGAEAAAGVGVAGLAATAFLATPGTAVIGIPVGLAVAVTGFIVLAKGYKLAKDSKELIAYCESALKAILELQECLIKMNDNLKRVNKELRSAIDFHLQDVDDSKLLKIALKKGQIQRSMIKKIETVVRQCGHIKEYCLPLRDADTLKEFMENTKSK